MSLVFLVQWVFIAISVAYATIISSTRLGDGQFGAFLVVGRSVDKNLTRGGSGETCPESAVAGRQFGGCGSINGKLRHAWRLTVDS